MIIFLLIFYFITYFSTHSMLMPPTTETAKTIAYINYFVSCASVCAVMLINKVVLFSIAGGACSLFFIIVDIVANDDIGNNCGPTLAASIITFIAAIISAFI